MNILPIIDQHSRFASYSLVTSLERPSWQKSAERKKKSQDPRKRFRERNTRLSSSQRRRGSVWDSGEGSSVCSYDWKSRRVCLSGAIRASPGPHGRTGVSTKRRGEKRNGKEGRREGRRGEEEARVWCVQEPSGHHTYMVGSPTWSTRAPTSSLNIE